MLLPRIPRRLFRLLFSLPVRLLHGDPWERYEHDVPLTAFGEGSKRAFRDYFAGESNVVVSSLDEVCNWLLDCIYVTDQEEFGVADYWQHPAEFEARRRGDCEDHALWAWRKLSEIGVFAELICGRCQGNNGTFRGHVWVHFTEDGTEYLLEATAASRSAMVRPLTDAWVRSAYSPYFSVDAHFRRHAYWGYVLAAVERPQPGA